MINAYGQLNIISGLSLESELSFIKEEAMNRFFVLWNHNFLSPDVLYEYIIIWVGNRKKQGQSSVFEMWYQFRASITILLAFEDHELLCIIELEEKLWDNLLRYKKLLICFNTLDGYNFGNRMEDNIKCLDLLWNIVTFNLWKHIVLNLYY